MNNLRNRVQLIGAIGEQIQYSKDARGEPMFRTALATKEVAKSKAGKKMVKLEWHHLVASGQTAEFMNTLLKKGHKIALEGKLKQHTFKDKEGIARYYSEIVVDEFVLIA